MSIPVVRENLAKKKDQAEDKIKTIEVSGFSSLFLQ